MQASWGKSERAKNVEVNTLWLLHIDMCSKLVYWFWEYLNPETYRAERDILIPKLEVGQFYKGFQGIRGTASTMTQHINPTQRTRDTETKIAPQAAPNDNLTRWER